MELERYCELIAALKLRTTNKAGRHLFTGRAIELMEDYGVETIQGLVKAPKGLLRRPTVNRHLSHCGSINPTCCANRQRCVFRQSTATTAGNSTWRRPTLNTSTSPIGSTL
ncbi:hypothetical protein [Janthinobacterium sp. CG_23.3]|uniref:hypothetical protein n=1 Tax=Janthinobacterium sp. CG_23.3 TaxID=3349634 RepID=UPI0038D3B726